MLRFVLVTDWDETATVADTTRALADLAAAKGPARRPFAHYSEVYMQAYREYERMGLPRSTVQEERAYQEGMEAVELSSIAQLEKDGFFRNIVDEDLEDLARKIELRPGFVDCVKNNGPAYVLSVNWCRKLIEYVLRFHGVTDVQVYANDFEYDSGVTTGRLTGSIRTGYDKLQKLQEIRMKCNSLVMYVGDSSGDVLPILQADVGILIRGGRGRKTLEAMNVDVRDLKNHSPMSHLSHTGVVFCGDWANIAMINN